MLKNCQLTAQLFAHGKEPRESVCVGGGGHRTEGKQIRVPESMSLLLFQSLLSVANKVKWEATSAWNNRTDPKMSRESRKFIWFSRKRRIRVNPQIWPGPQMKNSRGEFQEPNNGCWQRQVQNRDISYSVMSEPSKVAHSCNPSLSHTVHSRSG